MMESFLQKGRKIRTVLIVGSTGPREVAEQGDSAGGK